MKYILSIVFLFIGISVFGQNNYTNPTFLNRVRMSGSFTVKDTTLNISRLTKIAGMNVRGASLHFYNVSGIDSFIFDKPTNIVGGAGRVQYSDTAAMLSNYVVDGDIAGKVNVSDTSSMLSRYLRSALAATTYATISNLALKVNISDTAAMLNKYLLKTDTATMLVNYYNSAADIPTLNQNTTGSAAKLTTSRTINGNAFDGTANITVPTSVTKDLNPATDVYPMLFVKDTNSVNTYAYSSSRIFADGGSGKITATSFVGLWNGTSIDTAKTNAVSNVTSGGGLTITTEGKTKKITLSIKQTEVDFSNTGVTSKIFTITDATVSSTSNIVATVAYTAPTGRSLDELETYNIIVYCGQAATGSFQMLVKSSDNLQLTGKFKINYFNN